MDVLFKNSYERNEMVVKEMYRYFYLRKLMIFIYAVMFLALLEGIAFLIKGEIVGAYLIILVLVYFVLKITSYFRTVKLIIRRDKEMNAGALARIETSVMDSYVEFVGSNNSVTRLGYDKIKQAVLTKNLILLRSETKLMYVLHKDGFEIGACDDFVGFLKSKEIVVKGKL